jgi:pimeloyl-ACP methyl ester carboxylesterase
MSIPYSELADLRDRLAQARFTTASTAARGARPWATGVDPGYLEELVGYWVTSFDWRQAEHRLGGYPQFTSEINGHPLHYVTIAAADGARTAPFPVLLNHGWPSAFTEMLPLAERLSDPARFGLPDALAFDVVVPSLPGFVFSGLPGMPLTREVIADELHTLMTELGHSRYAVFGGDIGGAAGAWMAAKYPEHVVGLHMIHPPFPASFDDQPLTEEERAFIAEEEAYDLTDGGYSAIMITRPDTIAAALVDSPTGLAAWIVDKLRDWSDCGGDLDSRFDRDTILTLVSLYWLSGSIGSTFRQYVDYEHGRPRPPIGVPTAFSLSNEPVIRDCPRSIAERSCTDIRLWIEPGSGGHFMAHEEPDRVAADLRLFLGAL